MDYVFKLCFHFLSTMNAPRSLDAGTLSFHRLRTKIQGTWERRDKKPCCITLNLRMAAHNPHGGEERSRAQDYEWQTILPERESFLKKMFMLYSPFLNRNENGFQA